MRTTTFLQELKVLEALHRLDSAAARLRFVAKATGVQLVDLHRRTGIPVWRLQRVLSERFAPHPGELQVIAEALGVSPTDTTVVELEAHK